MSTVTIPKIKIQIMIVRRNQHYFYNRRANGVDEVAAQPISRDRAEEIITANIDSVTRQTGMVRFDAGDHEFSWSAEVWQ